MANLPPGQNQDLLTLPPFTAPQQQASTSSNTEAGPSKPKTGGARKRLSLIGRAILQDYYNNVSCYPSLSDKRDLLLRVNAIQGCEWYTNAHISKYFQRRRERQGHTNRKSSVGIDVKQELAEDNNKNTTDTILWPSLIPSKMKALSVLLKETPNPLGAEMEVWADALKVQLEDVSRWVKMQNANSKKTAVQNLSEDEEDELDDTHPHLPTPEATASPEPSYRRSFSYSSSVQQSPLVETFAPSIFTTRGPLPTPEPLRSSFTPISPAILSPVHAPPALPLASTIEPPQSSLDVPSPMLMLQNLALAYKTGISTASSQSSETKPLSPSEFASQFEPFERRMQHFLAKAQGGAYAEMGLEPSMVTKE